MVNLLTSLKVFSSSSLSLEAFSFAASTQHLCQCCQKTVWNLFQNDVMQHSQLSRPRLTDMVVLLTPHSAAIVHTKASISSCLSRSNHNRLFVRVHGLQGLASLGVDEMGFVAVGLSREAFRCWEAWVARAAACVD